MILAKLPTIPNYTLKHTYQVRDVAGTLTHAHNYITPAVAAAMGSCFALIGAYQIFLATLTSPSLEKPSTPPVAVLSFPIMAIILLWRAESQQVRWRWWVWPFLLG